MKQKNETGLISNKILEWITSYLVVLVIPILICAVFYVYSFASMWEETRNLNSSALQLVSDKLDDVFARSLNLEYNIQNEYNIVEVKKLSSDMDISEKYKLYLAMESFTQYSVADSAAFSSKIFFPELEVLMKPGAYYVMENKYSWFSEEYGISVDAFKELLFSKHRRDFFVNKSNGSVCYIATLPVTDAEARMNVIIELNPTYVQEILSSLDNMENSGFLIMTKDNEILFSHNVGDISIADIELPLEKTAEYHPMELDGQRVLISCVGSKNIGLTYVSIVPYTAFWSRALSNLYVFMVALFACIVVGTLAAWCFAKIKENAYGQLSGIITERIGSTNRSRFGFRQEEIAGAIRGIVDEYENMQKKLKSADNSRRELLLSAIMEGKVQTDDIEQVLRFNDVSVTIGNYVLLMLRDNQFNHMFAQDDEHISVQEVNRAIESAACVVSEAERRNISCEIIRVAKSIICILDFGEQSVEVCNSEVRSLTAYTKMQLESINSQVTISVSDVHNQVLSLSSAYTEALRVMDYQLADIEGNSTVMNYTDMIDNINMYYLFTLENEMELNSLLMAGKDKQAVQKIHEVCEKNIAIFKGNNELLKCLVWDLVACILKFENSMKNREGLPDTIKWIENVTKNVSVHESIRLLDERIGLICKLVRNVKANRDVDLINQIEEYIAANYADVNLCNTDIAEHFRISNGYLSTFFKENTGITLLDYIHQVRVEKAKELLKNEDLTVEQISAAVGCNGAALRRLFKKHVGVLPTQYRDDNRQ